MRDNTKSRLISLGKAISWRICGSLVTAVAFGGITQMWNLAFIIAGVELTAKVLLYYVHDRIWEYFIQNKDF